MGQRMICWVLDDPQASGKPMTFLLPPTIDEMNQHNSSLLDIVHLEGGREEDMVIEGGRSSPTGTP